MNSVNITSVNQRCIERLHKCVILTTLFTVRKKRIIALDNSVSEGTISFRLER